MFAFFKKLIFCWKQALTCFLYPFFYTAVLFFLKKVTIFPWSTFGRLLADIKWIADTQLQHVACACPICPLLRTLGTQAILRFVPPLRFTDNSCTYTNNKRQTATAKINVEQQFRSQRWWLRWGEIAGEFTPVVGSGFNSLCKQTRARDTAVYCEINTFRYRKTGVLKYQNNSSGA